MKSATINISYNITIKRRLSIDAENEEIDELLRFDNSSTNELPEYLKTLLIIHNSSRSSDKIIGFPNNVSITAVYDDPDDMNISK